MDRKIMTHPDTQTDKAMAGELDRLVDELFPMLMQGAVDKQKCYVPFAIVAQHETQAKSNHSQTVKRLAERGGLDPSELAAVLEDRPWRSMGNEAAWRSIYRALFQAALLSYSQSLSTRLAALEDQHVALQGRFAKLNIEREHQYTRAGDAESATPTERAKVIEEGEWLIYFEDADRRPELFGGENALEAASVRYRELGNNWSVRLFWRSLSPRKEQG